MNLQPTSFRWRLTLFVTGAFLVLLAIGLPVDRIVGRAISSQVMHDIQARGTPERLVELKQQFRMGLQCSRAASAVLGLWLLAIGVTLPRILRVVLDVTRFDKLSGAQAGTAVNLREIWIPAIWCLIVIMLGIPLLSKGFEHSEYLNYVMLAQRGPLVAAACQNLPPRAAQPGFTIVESIFVRIFGESEAVARLPALIFGAIALFPVFLISRRIGSKRFAGLVCGGMSVTGFYLFYITYARGYALSMMAYTVCVLSAITLRRTSDWRWWIVMGTSAVIAIYSHLSTALYVACLACVLSVGRMAEYRSNFRMAVKTLVQPTVTLVTCFLVVVLLYSPAIPLELKYIRTFDLTNYYMSYHLDFRFLKVMTELWAWIRDAAPLSWIQLALFSAGLIIGLMKTPWPTVCLVIPAVLALGLIGAKGLFVYPRFFIHFLPAYVLFSVLPMWALARKIHLSQSVAVFLSAVLLVFAGAGTLKRLYAMERCGARAAVQDACSIMVEGERLMATLDGYVTVKHYFPGVVSGYRAEDFWRELGRDDPPEYAVVVPYLDYDIRGGWNALRAKYELCNAYPSWLNVDDDQDTIYLYRLKKDNATTGQ
jgi:hypothetical protein